MSLHQLAQHMQSRGRGDDKMLVHMTPGEVHGLQALAMAHGGSLTINPETGLPEAGFLKKILPAVAGLALNAVAPGVGSAIGAALGGLSGAAGTGILVGGISALASGSLKQGLLDGMGAYGGANIGSALSKAGAAVPGTTEAVAKAATTEAPLVAPATGQIPTVAGGLNTASTAPFAANPAGYVQPALQRAQEIQQINAAGMSPWDKMSAGFEAATKNPQALKDFVWANKGSVLAAAAPMMQADMPRIPKEKSYIRPYTFERTPVAEYSDVPFNTTAERRYFDDNWVAGTPYVAPGPEYKAAGGIVALASGGNPYNTYSMAGKSGTSATSAQPTAAQKKKDSKYTIPVYSYDPRTGSYTLLATDSDNPNSKVAQSPAPTPTPATPVQVANMYNQMLRRPPTMEEIKAATGSNALVPDLKNQLLGSEEYLTNLTKPFVPRVSYDPDTGRAAVEGALRPYQSPAEQLGLTDFYDYMNQMLPQQAMRSRAYAIGGPVEQMSAENAVGSNLMYPQAHLDTSMYSNPMVQRPMPTNVITQGLNSPVDPYTGETKFAGGGLSDLGAYSDGGRLLKGPGDGVSDDIPAVIGERQPARLADGEFVVPARIVSELGNGSTEAGARKLYQMMDRVQKTRRKSVGKDKVAVDSKAEKHLPA